MEDWTTPAESGTETTYKLHKSIRAICKVKKAILSLLGRTIIHRFNNSAEKLLLDCRKSVVNRSWWRVLENTLCIDLNPHLFLSTNVTRFVLMHCMERPRPILRSHPILQFYSMKTKHLALVSSKELLLGCCSLLTPMSHQGIMLWLRWWCEETKCTTLFHILSCDRKHRTARVVWHWAAVILAVLQCPFMFKL